MRRDKMRATIVLLTFVLMWMIPIPAIPIQAHAAAKPITAAVDGSPIAFDAQPVLIDGTTLVQARPIMAKLGLDVEWDGDTQTVSGSFKGNLLIQLSIGSGTAWVGGEATPLEAAPRLIDGYTFVPLRLLAEATGRVVVWNGTQRKIDIHTPLSVYIRELLLDKGKLHYEGETIAGGVQDGQGRLFAGDVKLYDGEFKDGRMDGYGFLYRITDGSLLYAGRFADNAPSGEGVRYWPDGSKYTGEFAGGKQSGNGSLLDADGSLLFQGKWRDDFKNGEGAAYRKGKVIEKGLYVDGSLLEGRSVRMTFANGDSAVDIYEAGSAARRELVDLSGGLLFSSLDMPALYDPELRYGSDAQGIILYVPEYWRGKFAVEESDRQIVLSYKASSGKTGKLALIYIYTDAELRQLDGAGYESIGMVNGRHYLYKTAGEGSSGFEAGSEDAELYERLLFGVPHVMENLRFMQKEG